MSVPISGLAHIGIRVHDLDRSMKFYALLGFEKTMGPIGPEPVAILMHRGTEPPLEINLVLNAPVASTPNVLMDVPVKAPGVTHIALSCPDIAAAGRALEAAGFAVKDGPIRFPNGSHAIFVRDPDGVVIELNQPAG
jgi:lactoylglutathione lyase